MAHGELKTLDEKKIETKSIERNDGTKGRRHKRERNYYYFVENEEKM